GGFTIGMLNGGQGGAVVTGQASRSLVAFMSANGVSWQRTSAFGGAAAESVDGVSLTGGGAVVTGTVSSDPASRQPLITLVPSQGTPGQVDIAKIPGATDRQLAINAIAAAG